MYFKYRYISIGRSEIIYYFYEDPFEDADSIKQNFVEVLHENGNLLL